MKSYYDYQKNISNQSRDIAYLEQQARALAGVNNKSGKSRLASIQNELQSRKQDLSDTKFEHSLDLRREGYDRLLSDSQEAYDRLVDNTKRSTEEQDKVVSEYCDKAVAHYSTAYKTINDIVERHGLVYSDATKNVITKIGDIGTMLDSLADNYQTNTDAIVKLIKSHSGEIDTLASSYTTANTNASAFFGTIYASGQTFSDAQKSVQDYIKELNKIPKINVTDIEKVNTTGDEGFTRTAEEESARGSVKEVLTPTSNGSGGTLKAGQDTNDVGGDPEKDQPKDNAVGKLINEPFTVATTTPKVTTTTTTQKPATTTTTAKKTNAQWLEGYKATHNGLDMYNIASKFILKNATKLKKEKYADLSAANKKIYNYVKGDFATFKGSGGSLSTADMKTLASKLGVPWDDAHPMIDTGSKLNLVLKWLGFAKGSRYVNKDQLAWTQEKGQEVIFRKSDGAMLTPLGQGDKVFTAEMTDNLWKLAKGLTVDALSNTTDSSQIVHIKPVIDMSGMDNSIIIEGNANEDTVAQIRKVMDQRLNQFSKELTEDFGMFGHKIKF